MIAFRTKSILEFDKVINKLSNLAHTQSGKSMCKSLEPLSNLPDVLSAIKSTADAVNFILEKSVPPLSGGSDIFSSLSRSRTGADLSCVELLNIGNFLKQVSRIRSFAKFERAQWDNIVYDNIHKLVLIPYLQENILSAIAGEDELYDDASPKLFSIRRKVRDTQAQVKEQLDKILRTQKESLQEQLITMRGNRYVVPVRADRRSDIRGIVHDTSSSGATIFVEPMSVVEINNKIRELISEERYEIEKIISELSMKVNENLEDITLDYQLISFIDFVIAKGRLALLMKATSPKINDKGIIHLKNARHPLIPDEQVVPVTITIGEKYSTLVVTGPNTGGKTVSLKTCGLLTLMAMAGLMIPAAEGSIVSFFKNVTADIGDEQSIEQSLSTFSSHMSKLVNIVKTAGPSTLVLLDELGSGTDPAEGAALGISILDYLKSKGCITMATTHYKELKEYALITDGVENASCEFDIETLMPTYKLMIGLPGVSNAFAISSRLGLPSFIIDKAKELLSGKDIDFESILSQTQKALKETEKLRDRTEEEYSKAQEERKKYKVVSEEIEEKRKNILLRSRELAKDFVDETALEMEELLGQVKESIAKENMETTRQLLEEARAKVRKRKKEIDGDIAKTTIQTYTRGKKPDVLIEGEEYFSSSLGIHGVLVEINKSKNTCILKSGNKMLNVPSSSLVKAIPQKEKAKPQTRIRPSDNLSKKESISTEIKLLGFRVDEALDALDKYIDDCTLSGITSIRIIHGKGTGALSDAVRIFLKNDNRIRDFRFASYGEGDSGVTIADL